MKTGAIIAEYNPFHNGHQYQIEYFRKTSELDYVIVIMSGDFTQRGEPAWAPKHLRTRMALLGGADLVLELPAYYATGSASIFAEGAISHLNALNCVDELCFGCEIDSNLDEHKHKLSQAADILLSEPPLFKDVLSSNLKQGLSYPAARASALKTLIPDSDILFQPNNILALEYMTALKKSRSSIQPVLIQRKGAGYHDPDGSHPLASASALRQVLSSETPTSSVPGLPKESLTIIQDNYNALLPVSLNDFSSMFAASFMHSCTDLCRYTDMNEELANRMQHCFNSYTNLSSFLLDIKNKAYTYSRLCRCAAHILTNQQQAILALAKDDGYAYYARILGFRKSASPLLGQIKQCAHIPMISKMADYPNHLHGNGKTLMETDIFAADIYRTVLQMKFGQPLKNEFSEKIVII